MSTFPSISVIVPVYNEEKHIGRCLRSVIKQTIPDDDYEIIVINDGSTDRTSFRQGLINDFTGISSPHEKPSNPDLVVGTNLQTLDGSVDSVLSLLLQKEIFLNNG